MVHCLLDDTIKFVSLAKKHKHKLLNMKLDGDYTSKEENFTLFLLNGDTISFKNNICKIYNKYGNLINSFGYNNIDDALEPIDMYFNNL